jgi:hypothetical protein
MGVVREHLRPRLHTLALRDRITGEARLSAWMREHLRVTWA